MAKSRFGSFSSILRSLWLTALAVSMLSSTGQAATVSLFDLGFNLDGAVSFPTLGDQVPPGVDLTLYDTSTGLGEIFVNVALPGLHYVGIFVDLDLGTSGLDDFATVLGTLPTKAFFEADEPGFSFGDIDINFISSAPGSNQLENSNAITAAAFPGGEDVAMAFAFEFFVNPGDQLSLSFAVSESDPGVGFRLRQGHREDDSGVFLSGRIGTIPEPATLIPFCLAGMALLLLNRHRQVR